jgi:hypothetical protein
VRGTRGGHLTRVQCRLGWLTSEFIVGMANKEHLITMVNSYSENERTSPEYSTVIAIRDSNSIVGVTLKTETVSVVTIYSRETSITISRYYFACY